MLKNCKQYLKFGRDFHCVSFDGQNAQIAISFARHIFIAYEQRVSRDERAFGELFMMFSEEMKDITLDESMERIASLFVKAMLFYGIQEELVVKILDYAISNAPTYISNVLKRQIRSR